MGLNLTNPRSQRLPYPAAIPRSRDDLPTVGEGSVPILWVRAGARIVDQLILAIPMMAIIWPTIVIDPDGSMEFNPDVRSSLLLLCVASLYEATFLSLWGSTPGKALLGLRVVRFVDGDHPKVYQCVLRTLTPNLLDFFALGKVASWLSSLAQLYSTSVFASAVFDPIGRGLHDRVAGTILLRSR